MASKRCYIPYIFATARVSILSFALVAISSFTQVAAEEPNKVVETSGSAKEIFFSPVPVMNSNKPNPNEERNKTVGTSGYVIEPNFPPADDPVQGGDSSKPNTAEPLDKACVKVGDTFFYLRSFPNSGSIYKAPDGQFEKWYQAANQKERKELFTKVEATLGGVHK